MLTVFRLTNVKKMLLTSLLAFLLSSHACGAKAISVIDARYDLQQALQKYREEITEAVERSIKKRIHILINGNRGFNVGYLKIPNHIRRVDISVVIYVFRGREIIKPIQVNLFNLNSKQVVYQINQKLKIRG